jgi:hypothetical protein
MQKKHRQKQPVEVPNAVREAGYLRVYPSALVSPISTDPGDSELLDISSG